MKFPTRFDTTTSLAEFVRLLPRATGDANLRATPEGFAGVGWTLRLEPLPPLRIGLLCMERYRVEIGFEGLAADEQQRFMDRFGRYYQRGGG